MWEYIRYQVKFEQIVRQDLIPRVRHGDAALCTPTIEQNIEKSHKGSNIHKCTNSYNRDKIAKYIVGFIRPEKEVVDQSAFSIIGRMNNFHSFA